MGTGSRVMGPTGPQAVGPHGPPTGPQAVGPHGPPTGPQTMGPHGPPSSTTVGPQGQPIMASHPGQPGVSVGPHGPPQQSMALGHLSGNHGPILRHVGPHGQVIGSQQMVRQPMMRQGGPHAMMRHGGPQMVRSGGPGGHYPQMRHSYYPPQYGSRYASGGGGQHMRHRGQYMGPQRSPYPGGAGYQQHLHGQMQALQQESHQLRTQIQIAQKQEMEAAATAAAAAAAKPVETPPSGSQPATGDEQQITPPPATPVESQRIKNMTIRLREIDQ